MNNLLFMAGHKLFGTKHIIIIVISIALIVGLYFLSRKLSIKTLSKVLLGVGIVSEFTKIFSYIVMNENKVYTTFYKLVEGENGEQVFEAVESYKAFSVVFNGSDCLVDFQTYTREHRTAGIATSRSA